ncbi:MAG: AAA family ATPase [Chloroflexi bacterium]|nr:AAA family ATPase [Chloroflexota bacterium]
MSYIVGHPIKRPTDFYGRYNQVVRFFEIIGGTQAQSVSILGVRRAGKTSFLQYVAHKDVMARYLPDPSNYTMVYVDVSSCKTPTQFYSRLLRRLKVKLGNPESVTLWKESPAGSATMYDVESYLCQFPDHRIVLLLDEFDQLRIDTFDQDFLTELRAMTSVLDYDLACVTASYWDLYYLGNKIGLPPTSPFYNIFYPSSIYLSGLEEAEVETLIRNPIKDSGIEFSSDDVKEIRKLAGNLPFFIQATSAQWLRRKRSGKEIKSSHVLRQLAADMSPYFDQWWRYLDKVQQELMHSLAHTRLMDQLPYGSIELSEAIRHLQNYGLLCEEDGKLVINGSVFTSWIRQYAELKTNNENANGTNGNHVIPEPGTLRQILLHHFTVEELRNLCFDMDLDFEELPGREKGSKARSIVEYWRNRRELEKLVAAIRRERGLLI